jgi:hypothetical protein
MIVVDLMSHVHEINHDHVRTEPAARGVAHAWPNRPSFTWLVNDRQAARPSRAAASGRHPGQAPPVCAGHADPHGVPK